MTDRSGSDKQDDPGRGRSRAGIGTAAVAILGGLAYFANELSSGGLEFDASLLGIPVAVLGVAALVVIMVLVGALRAQKKRLDGLVAKVSQRHPDAVIVPGVVESGVVSFAANRPRLPGHVALAVLPDRVELWNWFSDEPHATVARTSGNITVEPITATSWNGRRTTTIDHLVCRDDELEMSIVPEYEVHRRADYPAGMRRALRELGLQEIDAHPARPADGRS